MATATMVTARRTVTVVSANVTVLASHLAPTAGGTIMATVLHAGLGQPSVQTVTAQIALHAQP